MKEVAKSFREHPYLYGACGTIGAGAGLVVGVIAGSASLIITAFSEVVSRSKQSRSSYAVRNAILITSSCIAGGSTLGIAIAAFIAGKKDKKDD